MVLSRRELNPGPERCWKWQAHILTTILRKTFRVWTPDVVANCCKPEASISFIYDAYWAQQHPMNTLVLFTRETLYSTKDGNVCNFYSLKMHSSYCYCNLKNWKHQLEKHHVPMASSDYLVYPAIKESKFGTNEKISILTWSLKARRTSKGKFKNKIFQSWGDIHVEKRQAMTGCYWTWSSFPWNQSKK